MYEELKCGSCEGCWFKTNFTVPDSVEVISGRCPCYKKFELAVGRKVLIQHWGVNSIIEGTISSTGMGALTIEVDSGFIIDDKDYLNVFPSLNTIHSYMDAGYRMRVKNG